MEKEKIEAFKTLFGFDITDFDSMYENSRMGIFHPKSFFNVS